MQKAVAPIKNKTCSRFTSSTCVRGNQCG